MFLFSPKPISLRWPIDIISSNSVAYLKVVREYLGLDTPLHLLSKVDFGTLKDPLCLTKTHSSHIYSLNCFLYIILCVFFYHFQPLSYDRVPIRWLWTNIYFDENFTNIYFSIFLNEIRFKISIWKKIENTT